MTPAADKTLRLIFPQWEGGNNPPYYLGAQLLAWLAPAAHGPVATVPVTPPDGQPLSQEAGITARHALLAYRQAAQALIAQHQPEAIAVLGGDCLVSLAPFSWLQQRYGDKLGILWIDAHPDVQTPAQYPNAHAHVLAALMGHGDPDLTAAVPRPIAASNIMIAGIHHPLPYEAAFLAEHGIRTCDPQAVREGAAPVQQWLQTQDIQAVAIHFDLDVLDPLQFRSVLFARPGRGAHDFGDVAEGKLSMAEVLALIQQVAARTPVVGLSIAEHLPWDALALQNMLAELPLLGHHASAT